MPQIELHHNGLSSCSQKVRLVLAEKGLDFTSRDVNLVAGEQQSAQAQRIAEFRGLRGSLLCSLRRRLQLRDPGLQVADERAGDGVRRGQDTFREGRQ